MDNGQKVQLQFWDTGGQECFVDTICKGAHIVLYCFDLTEPFPRFHDRMSPPFGIHLVGLKCDLADSRAVTQDQVDLFRAQRPEIVSYQECSAKTGQGTDQLLLNLALVMVDLPECIKERCRLFATNEGLEADTDEFKTQEDCQRELENSRRKMAIERERTAAAARGALTYVYTGRMPAAY